MAAGGSRASQATGRHRRHPRSHKGVAMQRPAQSACSPLHHSQSQPPSTALPHARAPPLGHRRHACGQLRRPRARSILSMGEVQQMKRRIAVVALVFVAFALIAQQALAVSPHFISASATLNANGTLTVSFKEAGSAPTSSSPTRPARTPQPPTSASTRAAATRARRTRRPSLAP
jgi:hypothetical protein